MIRDQKHEKRLRLQSKTLDAAFARLVENGLNCSPFESEMIVKLVHSTYLSEKTSISSVKSGQMVITATSEFEGVRRKISEAATVPVVITIEDSNDIIVREKEGVVGLRRCRIQRVCRETLDQGGLLTVEDLAHRIFNVGERTIVRDLAALRKDGVIIPLRSTVRDIGRTVSHKEEIVRLWLLGKQYDAISRQTHHSIPSICSYLKTFKRIIALEHEGHTEENIAFIAGASTILTRTYLKLWTKYRDKTIQARKEEISAPFRNTENAEKHELKKGGRK